MNKLEKSPLSKQKKITRNKAEPEKMVVSGHSEKNMVNTINKKYPPVSPKGITKTVTNGIPKT